MDSKANRRVFSYEKIHRYALSLAGESTKELALYWYELKKRMRGGTLHAHARVAAHCMFSLNLRATKGFIMRVPP